MRDKEPSLGRGVLAGAWAYGVTVLSTAVSLSNEGVNSQRSELLIGVQVIQIVSSSSSGKPSYTTDGFALLVKSQRQSSDLL